MDTHEENGGTACSDSSTEQQSCNTATCPAGMNNGLNTWLIFLNDNDILSKIVDLYNTNFSQLCMGYMEYMGNVQ